jgi:hypothetical protein
LKFAIENPATRYDEVPASSLFPPKHFEKSTAVSTSRQLTKQIYVPKNEPESKTKDRSDKTLKHTPINAKSTTPFSAAVAENLNNRRGASARTNAAMHTTLLQIEEVLEGLNINSSDIMKHKGYGGPDNTLSRGVSRPNTALKGLVDMINNVMDDIQH